MAPTRARRNVLLRASRKVRVLTELPGSNTALARSYASLDTLATLPLPLTSRRSKLHNKRLVAMVACILEA